MIKDPNHPDIYSMKGRVHAEKHEWEQAKENYLKSLSLEKNNESAIAGLALLPDDCIPSSLAREIIAFADGGVTFDDKSFWSFILSELKKKSGHISEAFDALANANQMRFRELKNEKPENGLKILQDYSNKIKVWSPTSQAVVRTSQEILVILGPSRSGKTTIESLLSESGFIQRAYESANASRMHTELKALPFQEGLDQEEAEKNVLRILFPYRDELLETKKPISITNPFLLPSADMIYELYPNSRFIFLSRNEVDNACDIYKKDYQAKRGYFYDPDLIVEYIRLYNEITKQLHSKFGKRSLMFRYEDIVVDKNTVLNTVADWVSLEKNALKLEPNEDTGNEYKAHPYRELFIKQYPHLFRSN